MEIIAALDTAQAAVRVACDAVSRVRDTLFFRFEDPDVLLLARDLERLSRLVYTAQIHLVGDLHNRGAAGTRSCTSTAAMIREALVISPGDAKGRVNAAKAVIAQETVTGVVIDPTLPHLRAAVDDGRIGVEQIRIIQTTMRKIPAQVDPVTRESCEHTLVEHGQFMEPQRFARFARRILLIVDPNGDLDKDPSDRVELSIGTRNAETGMTRFTGQLDDEGVEVLTQAIDADSTPRSTDGVPDRRSPANRRGLALKRLRDSCGPTLQRLARRRLFRAPLTHPSVASADPNRPESTRIARPSHARHTPGELTISSCSFYGFADGFTAA